MEEIGTPPGGTTPGIDEVPGTPTVPGKIEGGTVETEGMDVGTATDETAGASGGAGARTGADADTGTAAEDGIGGAF